MNELIKEVINETIKQEAQKEQQQTIPVETAKAIGMNDLAVQKIAIHAQFIDRLKAKMLFGAKSDELKQKINNCNNLSVLFDLLDNFKEKIVKKDKKANEQQTQEPKQTETNE